MKRKLLSLVSAVVLTFSMAGQVAYGTTSNAGMEKSSNASQSSSYERKNGQIFTLTLFQNPKTLDIQKTNADYFIPLQIYDRLVEVKVENGKPTIVPSLAEKWEISPDGKVYTFHLKKGVKFHNGEEFKADDVLFTIEKMMDPKEATVNSFQFEKVKGALDKLNGKADKVTGVKVIDDYTVEITLESAYAPFLASLTGAPASIFNRKAVTEGKEKFGFEPQFTVGTGYMKFQDWTQDKEINLVKNEDYFGEKAQIDGVKYLMNIDKATQRMMFENGELDFINLDQTALENYKNNEIFKDSIIEFQPPSMDYMIFNQKDPNMAKVEVRKAVSMLINRDILNKNFYNGEGILFNGVVPPAMPGYNENAQKIEYNVEGAKELLKKAGAENINLVLLQNAESEYTHPMNEMIQSMLGEAGITVEIKNVDMTTYWDTISKGDGFAFSIGPMTADVPDPDDFYKAFTVEASKTNGFNVLNKELSDKINQARNIVDDKERLKALNDLDKEIVIDNALYLPIAAQKRYFIKSPKVDNLILSWQGWICGATKYLKINK